jgi:hypothetical protein
MERRIQRATGARSALRGRARPAGRAWQPPARTAEFADPRRTLAALSGAGLDAEVVAWQWIPFGPVLTSRAWWLEETDRLDPGRREQEELLVIRADKP